MRCCVLQTIQELSLHSSSRVSRVSNTKSSCSTLRRKLLYPPSTGQEILTSSSTWILTCVPSPRYSFVKQRPMTKWQLNDSISIQMVTLEKRILIYHLYLSQGHSVASAKIAGASIEKKATAFHTLWLYASPRLMSTSMLIAQSQRRLKIKRVQIRSRLSSTPQKSSVRKLMSTIPAWSLTLVWAWWQSSLWRILTLSLPSI